MAEETAFLSGLVSEDGYARLQLRLDCSLADAVGLIEETIRICETEGRERLLVDIRDVTGFPPPPVADRFFFISDWARAAGGRVRLAIVARPDYIHPQKIGVTIAGNRGLIGEIFDDESAAVEWLLS
jgi:hypothetical protein